MSKPLPPIVVGPITTASKSIQVTGWLPGATVELLEGGSTLANTTPDGWGWVTLSTSPTASGNVVAKQTAGGQTSEQSVNSVPVLPLPNPMPAPLFVTPLSDGMDYLGVDGLVNGATLELRVEPSAQVIANTPVTVTPTAIGLNLAVPLAGGNTIQAIQSVGAHKSAPVLSMPLTHVAFNKERPLPPPGLGPLQACQTSIAFSNAIPSADMLVTSVGGNYEWLNVAATYTGTGAGPLKTGALSAIQSFKRLNLKSNPTNTTVHPAKPPPAPVLAKTICPTVDLITASNLVPGAVLHILVRVYATPADVGSASYVSETEIGEAGIQQTTQDFFIPSGAIPSGPTNVLGVVVFQELCTVKGPDSNVAAFPASAHQPPPTITAPLIDCAHLIQVKGAAVGASVQAFVDNHPNSNLVSVPVGGTVIIPLWQPLVTNQTVIVEQKGCNADGKSPQEKVHPVPSPLMAPTVQTPLHPGQTQVTVNNVVPGAYVYVFVDNDFYGKLGATSVVIVDVPALVAGQQVKAVQTICSESSTKTDQKPVVVSVGSMKVTASPQPVQRGTSVTETVTVIDAVGGQPVVGATISLNGTVMGTTDAGGHLNFTFAPTLGEPNPTGKAHDAPGYTDATYTISLVDPPHNDYADYSDYSDHSDGWDSDDDGDDDDDDGGGGGGDDE